MACKPFKPKPIRRKIFLWKKADIYKIKEDLTIFNTTRKNIDINVESMWQAFFFHIFLVSLSDFPLYFLF
jgi:hypothetical protein